MWLLFQQSQSLGQTPSITMGLTPGSYEAFCLDQAVWYLGATITNELEKAGHKPAKGEQTMVNARKRVLAKYLGNEAAPTQMYAEPVFPDQVEVQ